ncbi:hypothetical protein PMZ80_001875 [Knufia obscura]|uniref:Uncharacterized protein n=2 Tax=Knufia TaxID=430999 RepID=A0AAN8EED7_9EURO|nr:hypothetical protein PMZ80_001875 [Knufia obscura]KAK5953694.1 hypothetical protein OHC33_004963 [Knufia fluminis]
MDHANTQSTVLNEQSQNPSQSGSASTSISKDVGKNLSAETSSSGGGLDERMDAGDASKTSTFGSTKAGDHGAVVGAEGDAHEGAAAKQP